MRPVSLPKWPHPLAGTTLPRFGRLVRASAPLLMQLQYKNFSDESRGPLSAEGGRTVHVINAALPICEQKFDQSSAPNLSIVLELVTATVGGGFRCSCAYC